MKLKIAIGKLNQVDQLDPIKQADYEIDSSKSAMDAFKKFFEDASDISIPQDVEYILQAGENWTISTILSIRYFLKREGLGLEYYAFNEADVTILDDITRTSGILLLDEAMKYYGFIPMGHFLKFNSEEDANPIAIYTWIATKVRMFPGISSDPYTTALTQTKELMQTLGSISTPIVSKFMLILADFEKRIVII